MGSSGGTRYSAPSTKLWTMTHLNLQTTSLLASLRSQKLLPTSAVKDLKVKSKSSSSKRLATWLLTLQSVITCPFTHFCLPLGVTSWRAKLNIHLDPVLNIGPENWR